jgi:ribonuclease VapC
VIAVDTSALMAILQKEADSESCVAALGAHDRIVMSAGTAAEALLVAGHRNGAAEMERLIAAFDIEVVPVTLATARRVADAHARWGKGVHPARLNFGDCFSYEVASHHACPLLFIGGDFAKTDLVGVL